MKTNGVLPQKSQDNLAQRRTGCLWYLAAEWAMGEEHNGTRGDYVLDSEANLPHTTCMVGKTHRVGPSIIDTARVFASEENCHTYLEAARWPNGVTCLQCGHSKISKFTVK